MPNLRKENRGGVIVTDTTDDQALVVIDAAVILDHVIPAVFFTVGIAGGSVIAFDQFTVEGQAVNGGTWSSLRAATWTTADEFVAIAASTALNTLAHGASGFCTINTKGLYAIRFKSAQAGVTAVAVTRTLEVGAAL